MPATNKEEQQANHQEDPGGGHLQQYSDKRNRILFPVRIRFMDMLLGLFVLYSNLLDSERFIDLSTDRHQSENLAKL